jgi:hypothetical protein
MSTNRGQRPLVTWLLCPVLYNIIWKIYNI